MPVYNRHRTIPQRDTQRAPISLPKPCTYCGLTGTHVSVSTWQVEHICHICPCVSTYVHSGVRECAPGFRGCAGHWDGPCDLLQHYPVWGRAGLWTPVPSASQAVAISILQPIYILTPLHPSLPPYQCRQLASYRSLRFFSPHPSALPSHAHVQVPLIILYHHPSFRTL